MAKHVFEDTTFEGAVEVQEPLADSQPATRKYVDDEIAGSSGLSGSGSAGELAVFDSSGTLQGDPAFYWDGTYANVADSQSGNIGLVINNSGTDAGSRALLAMRAEAAWLDMVCRSATDGGSYDSVSRDNSAQVTASNAACLFLGTTDAAPTYLMANGKIYAELENSTEILNVKKDCNFDGDVELSTGGIGEFGSSAPATQPAAIADVPTGGSADAAANATAINAILAVLRARGTIATT